MNSVLLRSKEISNFSQHKFRITFPVSSRQWTLWGHWQCSDVEKLEITSRVKWVQTVLMYLNLWYLCRNMSFRKWCAKFDYYWRGESGTEPRDRKVKGASSAVSGKCVLSLLLSLQWQEEEGYQSRIDRRFGCFRRHQITVSLKKSFINFFGWFCLWTKGFCDACRVQRGYWIP